MTFHILISKIIIYNLYLSAQSKFKELKLGIRRRSDEILLEK